WVLADRAERGASTWPPALALFAALSWQASVSFHPTAYALVVTAIVLGVRWRSLGRRGATAAAVALVACLAVILLLAIPYLATVAGVVLVVTGAVLAIGASDRGWRRFTPYRALYEWVPGWRALRATDRAWFIGILGMGLLAGLGVRAVGHWLTRRRLAVGAAA